MMILQLSITLNTAYYTENEQGLSKKDLQEQVKLEVEDALENLHTGHLLTAIERGKPSFVQDLEA